MQVGLNIGDGYQDYEGFEVEGDMKVIDTLHQIGLILIYNNECYLKPYIRRVVYFILI
jgi:hypothetical protein